MEHTKEAVHKAILIQEQETKIKGKIKVWRHDHDEVGTIGPYVIRVKSKQRVLMYILGDG